MNLSFNRSARDYLELMKPRITLLVLVTTTIGYYLGGEGIRSWPELMFLLLGVFLVCSGAGSLNHYLERELDVKMVRTQLRPIPAGRIAPINALQFGLVLTLIGIFVLYVKSNVLTAFLSLLTVFLYVLVYTPMKRVSWLNTTVGAFPGAMPPLGGWAAATGTLNFDAGILFLILFIWQHPHFYAIAWMCRDDYARGGFKMLPCVDPSGQSMFRQIHYFSVLLIPVSLVPSLTGMSGSVYFVGALIAGLALLYFSEHFIRTHKISDAKRLLRATVIYLPVLLGLIVLDTNF